MGVVSKKLPKPLKYKIIHDLSWRGANQRRFRSQYDTLDRTISLVQKSDTEAQMAKLGLSHAYRHIHVQPKDQELSGSTVAMFVDGNLLTG